MKRHPLVMAIVGMKGVGKTYLNLQRILAYIKNNPKTGKNGHKVLVYNVNMEPDYVFPTIDADPFNFHKNKNQKSVEYIDPVSKKRKKLTFNKPEELYALTRQMRVIYFKLFKSVSIRMVLPLWKNNMPMTGQEKKDLLLDIIAGFRNGLILLEDIDKYASRANDQELIDVLTTNRHTSTDVWIVHQTAAKITTTEWENITNLRMHYQNDDLNAYIDDRRCPNKEMVKIADIIITEQYNKATDLHRAHKITDEEYDKFKSLPLYLDFPTNKISGVSPQAFKFGCYKYLMKNYTILKRLGDERNIDGTRKYTAEQAFLVKMKELLRYYA